MSGWTKGPWKVDGFEGRVEKICSEGDHECCIAVMPHWHLEHFAELAANARLISKAPEMYDELALALQHLRHLMPNALGHPDLQRIEQLLKELEP